MLPIKRSIIKKTIVPTKDALLIGDFIDTLKYMVD